MRRSGERVREIYDEYLQDFEKHYTMMVLVKLVRTNPLSNQPSIPPRVILKVRRQRGARLLGDLRCNNPRVDPRQLILQLVQGNVSVEVMRSKGVPDSLIEQVEILRRRVSSGIKASRRICFRAPAKLAAQLPFRIHLVLRTFRATTR